MKKRVLMLILLLIISMIVVSQNNTHKNNLEQTIKYQNDSSYCDSSKIIINTQMISDFYLYYDVIDSTTWYDKVKDKNFDEIKDLLKSSM